MPPQVPANWILVAVSVLVALTLFATAGSRRWKPVVVAFVGWAVLAVLVGSLWPSLVQNFVASPNEAIYGLGQFQNRTMNYRGIPLELLQFNTHISNPLMVSTRGYGVLWANPSKCFFNQPDSQITMTSGS